MEPGGWNGVFPVFLFDRHSCLSRLESVGDDLERHFSGFSLAGAQNDLGKTIEGLDFHDFLVFRIRHGGEVRGITVADAGDVRGAAYLEGELVFASGHPAKIHPEKVANQLTESSIHLLHDSIIEILQKAIKLGGSSIRTYSALGSTGKMQDELRVYGKTGEKCVRCGNEIQKIKVAGRGTHFCPFCQQK